MRVATQVMWLICGLCLASRIGAAGVALVIPEPPAPAAVREMAVAFAATLPMGADDADRREARRSYENAFFEAFTSMTTRSGGDGPRTAGFIAGQEFRKTRPSRQAEIMTGFGYTHVVIVGLWQIGFEGSRLVSGPTGQQSWWLERMPDATIGIDMGAASRGMNRDNSWSVRVEGWLSPAGRFGHMGVFKRQLLATSIEPDASPYFEEPASGPR